MIVRNKARAIVALSTGLLVLSGVAHADRRNPAPITYGGQSEATPHPRTNTAPNVSTNEADASTRIEFRYPGTEQAATPAPRQYAALPTVLEPKPAPVANPFAKPADLATPAMKPVTTPIRISADKPAEATPVGRPLSLSRVSTNRGATMSEETGRAGVYTDGFDGRPTANGEIFDSAAMTAAHPNLPLPSLVQVVNQSNGREIVVRVNDRGPFAGNRIIDLSDRAASTLGFSEGQTVNVRLRYLGPAPVMQVADNAAPQRVYQESLPAFEPAPVVKVAEYPAGPIVVSAPAATLRGTPSVPGLSGNVYIQAGSFADIGNAQVLSNALGRGLPVEIQEARVRNADYFRVMVGPFQTREQAEIHRSQLAERGIAQGFIVER